MIRFSVSVLLDGDGSTAARGGRNEAEWCVAESRDSVGKWKS